MLKNNCLYCKKEITQFLIEVTGYVRKDKARKWCDRKCYDSYRLQQATEKVKNIREIRCLNCKKYFSPVRVKNNGTVKDKSYQKKFCSHKCWRRHLHKNRKESRIINGKKYARYHPPSMTLFERKLYKKEKSIKESLNKIDNWDVSKALVDK